MPIKYKWVHSRSVKVRIVLYAYSLVVGRAGTRIGTPRSVRITTRRYGRNARRPATSTSHTWRRSSHWLAHLHVTTRCHSFFTHMTAHCSISHLTLPTWRWSPDSLIPMLGCGSWPAVRSVSLCVRERPQTFGNLANHSSPLTERSRSFGNKAAYWTHCSLVPSPTQLLTAMLPITWYLISITHCPDESRHSDLFTSSGISNPMQDTVWCPNKF